MTPSNVNALGTDWLYIKRWLKEQREQANNEMAQGLAQEEYQRVVGRIDLMRRLEDWVEPSKSPEIMDDTYGMGTGEESKY